MPIFNRMVFQGSLLGSIFLIIITRWIANPNPQQSIPIENAAATINNLPDGSSLSPLYPPSIQEWRTLIEQCAEQFQLDPDLVAAVMLQESGGNAGAYSHSGAVGLMQVMPSDGLAASFVCENGPCFANRPNSDQLFNPDFNIDYGCRMLRGLIDRQPTLRDALKAYGPKDYGYTYADLVISIYERFR